MGLYLIAFISLSLLLTIVKVAIALGLVIFVHELGHFAVAKLCGVKCEKFYLGFDIGGLKLCKFQWGETEYGIGILPLGGYVKMLGQEDNPAQEAGENERDKVGAPGAETLDPRSYKAQSVPRRMAIISAGVVMNLIFACVFAAIAYRMGFEDSPCVIGGVLPGEPAWRADVQPCDRILAIDGQTGQEGQPLRFRDLTSAVFLGNLKEGVKFEIERDGVAKPIDITVYPAERSGERLHPTIGVQPVFSPQLADKVPGRRGTPTADVKSLQGGDKIVAIDDRPIDDIAALIRELTRHADGVLHLRVERKPKLKEGQTAADAGPAAQIDVEVPPTPIQTLGLTMKMGPLTAVQEHSPAAEAGLQADDMIVAIDGQPIGDPLTLPDRLAAKAGQSVTLTITRSKDGVIKTVEKSVTPREPDYWDEPYWLPPPGCSKGAPALGIAYRMENVIDSIAPGSPAEAAKLEGKANADAPDKLAPGMAIVQAEFLLPERKESADDELDGTLRKASAIKFSSKELNWPTFHQVMQMLPPGTKIKLTTSDERTVELTPVAATDWFNPDRGFNLDLAAVRIHADSLGRAIVLGIGEARDSVTQVYRFLRNLGTQISVKGLGGPISIAHQAGQAASVGLPELLLFLTMLSANLAVINFLPIPILDGGHMVFLILEGILKRPVNERVVIAFHYAGFLFIISLMVFVFGLDLSRYMN